MCAVSDDMKFRSPYLSMPPYLSLVWNTTCVFSPRTCDDPIQCCPIFLTKYYVLEKHLFSNNGNLIISFYTPFYNGNLIISVHDYSICQHLCFLVITCLFFQHLCFLFLCIFGISCHQLTISVKAFMETNMKVC